MITSLLQQIDTLEQAHKNVSWKYDWYTTDWYTPELADTNVSWKYYYKSVNPVIYLCKSEP